MQNDSNPENPKAFPTTVQLEVMDDNAPSGYRTVRLPDGGMTLRDYFAAAVLSGIYAGGSHTRVAREVADAAAFVEPQMSSVEIGHEAERLIAAMAYATADAMLAERSK